MTKLGEPIKGNVLIAEVGVQHIKITLSAYFFSFSNAEDLACRFFKKIRCEN